MGAERVARPRTRVQGARRDAGVQLGCATVCTPRGVPHCSSMLRDIPPRGLAAIALPH